MNFNTLFFFSDELHFDNIDLNCDGNYDNDNENRSDTNNGNDDFSMTWAPSLVQG